MNRAQRRLNASGRETTLTPYFFFGLQLNRSVSSGSLLHQRCKRSCIVQIIIEQ
jgi:hypothetical protein